ncbi:flagellar basal-body MS-ring/collar protein FliF [Clostridium guangxiense]|uniref:flagellar basal-body MS-ring/collar protein FliF n=1 Tax=Clostridium guangxiense TaxID=1662055 RepID=UPI001E5FD98F|nr:flagellar basal-body MS-ring/collar protein FliF [Clostridium guangxiense]MCD2345234.1 flagellar M-ring protein FliF [Clostridium guangxiense]
MNKLLNFFKGLFSKWKALSKKKKVAFIILIVGILAALSLIIMSKTTTKYGVLFSKLDSNDAATVISKLDTLKVAHKEDSSTNTIYVPKDKVDNLRLQLTSTLTNGSKGFELFDASNSKFGTTDAEFNVEYQRALQGELEKTIKSLDGVDDARVTLVMPKDSVFVKDSTKATASVTIKMKTGSSDLSKSQVMAIVSLVSGSVSNLPKENIQVIDDKMNLLSKDLFKSDDGSDSSETAEDRNKVEQQKDEYYEKKALDVLEDAYGKGKVKVKVNVELNFDASQTDSETYYNNPTDQKDTKNPVVVSEHNTSNSSSGTNAASGSPTNNNNSNTITNGGNNTSTSTDSTKNYDVSSEKTKTVKSPGDVKRLTISVLVDGNVDANTQDKVSNIVGNAVGFDTKRGDSISVEGMSFDNSAQKAAQKALDEMKAEEQAAKNQKMYIAIGIASAVVLAALIVLGVRLIKKRRAAKLLAAEAEAEEDETQSIDVVVDDEAVKENKQKFAPINFEREDENSHVENEIKKYAANKPEQVVDIIKAWLASDER